jgi:hypothetical protein
MNELGLEFGGAEHPSLADCVAEHTAFLKFPPAETEVVVDGYPFILSPMP